jgi:hypothetical protein
MRDIEILARHIGLRLFLERYTGRMKEFIDFTCIDLNDNWATRELEIVGIKEEFFAAIEVLQEIFEGKVARKSGSRLFNRSIFDALAYYSSFSKVRDAMQQRSGAVRAAYEELVETREFLDAVESDTAGLPHTATRLRLWGEALSRALDIPIPIPRLEGTAESEFRLVV